MDNIINFPQQNRPQQPDVVRLANSLDNCFDNIYWSCENEIQLPDFSPLDMLSDTLGMSVTIFKDRDTRDDNNSKYKIIVKFGGDDIVAYDGKKLGIQAAKKTAKVINDIVVEHGHKYGTPSLYAHIDS